MRKYCDILMPVLQQMSADLSLPAFLMISIDVKTTNTAKKQAKELLSHRILEY